jgi:hypothetical protein
LNHCDFFPVTFFPSTILYHCQIGKFTLWLFILWLFFLWLYFLWLFIRDFFSVTFFLVTFFPTFVVPTDCCHLCFVQLSLKGLSRSYGSRIYNYLCHQCLSSLTWVQVQSTQHYMIKFVSDLRQVCGYLWVLPYPIPKKYQLPGYNWNIIENK